MIGAWFLPVLLFLLDKSCWTDKSIRVSTEYISHVLAYATLKLIHIAVTNCPARRAGLSDRTHYHNVLASFCLGPSIPLLQNPKRGRIKEMQVRLRLAMRPSLVNLLRGSIHPLRTSSPKKAAAAPARARRYSGLCSRHHSSPPRSRWPHPSALAVCTSAAGPRPLRLKREEGESARC